MPPRPARPAARGARHRLGPLLLAAAAAGLPGAAAPAAATFAAGLRARLLGGLSGLGRPGGARAPSVAAEATTADEGRLVRIETERVREVDLPGATVQSMDRLMREEAVQVLASGAERAERAPGAGRWYAYMPGLRVGTWRYQVRLLCEVQVVGSGSASVDVVGFEVGTEEGGTMVFKSYDSAAMSLSWANSVAWRPAPGQEGALRLRHSSTGKLRLILPWWFPLPDAVVRVATESAIDLTVRDGQGKVMAAIRRRHAEREGAASGAAAGPPAAGSAAAGAQPVSR